MVFPGPTAHDIQIQNRSLGPFSFSPSRGPCCISLFQRWSRGAVVFSPLTVHDIQIQNRKSGTFPRFHTPRHFMHFTLSALELQELWYSHVLRPMTHLILSAKKNRGALSFQYPREMLSLVTHQLATIPFHSIDSHRVSFQRLSDTK